MHGRRHNVVYPAARHASLPPRSVCASNHVSFAGIAPSGFRRRFLDRDPESKSQATFPSKGWRLIGPRGEFKRKEPRRMRNGITQESHRNHRRIIQKSMESHRNLTGITNHTMRRISLRETGGLVPPPRNQRIGQDRTWQDSTGLDRTGRDRTRLDKTGQHMTEPDIRKPPIAT